MKAKMKTDETGRKTHPTRPNIVVLLADDLGFSDVGCFGSEIRTPHIDSLARDGGVRFSQMYNCARCCPSRAALLTGAYPHRAGIGHMVYDAGVGPAYQGYLRRDLETVAEMLRREHPPPAPTGGANGGGGAAGEGGGGGGYATFMAGKWHVGSEYPPDASPAWVQRTMGDEAHPTPTQRGFDRFYGTLGGGGSYYRPPSLVEDDAAVAADEVLPEGFYYTDAINDKACEFVDCAAEAGRPFFLYVAHCAPHW